MADNVHLREVRDKLVSREFLLVLQTGCAPDLEERTLPIVSHDPLITAGITDKLVPLQVQQSAPLAE